jgi:hypothetical protein
MLSQSVLALYPVFPMGQVIVDVRPILTSLLQHSITR